MIKAGITNFFHSLKYIFTLLGTLFLGLILGLSVALPAIFRAISELMQNINGLSSAVEIRFSDCINYFYEVGKSLNWSNPAETIRIILNGEWIGSTLKEWLHIVLGENYTEYHTSLVVFTDTFQNDIGIALVFMLVFTLLGIAGGYFLTKYLIRRKIARRALWKYFLVSAIDSILSATLVAACTWFLSVWKPSILISTVLSLLLFGGISFFEAYVVHGWKKIALRDILTIKNIGCLLATDFIIFAVSAAIITAFILILNAVVGFFIGFALMEIAFMVIGMNAEAYVKSVADSSKFMPVPLRNKI